ncbi:MAG: dTDP-4-dehydrorhamnose reductase [Chitinophagaceae bacterium]|nr:dTDP-4-dehydrorhamnose reductase [Chitinophagaceae bacterium]
MNNKENTILVTGSAGQLGSELRDLAPSFPQYRFLFTDRNELDITDQEAVSRFFEEHQPGVCINCGAYTAVDKAESETEKAFAVNAEAAGNLASACRENNSLLIQISTDYVFDGIASPPYREDHPVSPLNVYGASKLKGEQLALQNNPATILIRTSWVYSSHGHNFVKTMLRLMNEKDSINVVDDQWGSPTYAADLATSILQIIGRRSALPQENPVYHYCNNGFTNWFEFTKAIKEFTGSSCKINPIPTSAYPTAAKRPAYSVLNTDKISKTFQLEIPSWQDGLERCLKRLMEGGA